MLNFKSANHYYNYYFYSLLYTFVFIDRLNCIIIEHSIIVFYIFMTILYSGLRYFYGNRLIKINYY